MSKKKIIISIVVLIILGIALNAIFNQPKEFQVEDVMFDRGGAEI